METEMKCKDCKLCRIDLVKKVQIGEWYDDANETMQPEYVDKCYCGHKVALVNPKTESCDFLKPRDNEVHES